MSENEEKRPEVGKKLHDARVAKGLTLDDLQQATKIQKRYLIAIEDEKFDELPGDFYVRAFVKQYADTVGLDGEDLLKEYDDDLPKAKTDEYSEHIAQAVETRATSKRKLTKVNDARKYLPTLIAIIVVIVVLAAIWLTAIVRSHKDSSTKIDNSSVKVSGESSKKSSSSSKKKSSSSSKKTSSNIKLTATNRTSSAVTFTGDALSKDTTLTIKTSGQAWNAVTVDNSQRLSKTMSANQTQTIKIAKSAQTIVLTLGNASATTVKLGNTTLDLTQNNTYPNTRTVTIKLGNTTQSSSASSTSSSTTATSSSQSTSSTTSASNLSSSSTTASSTQTTASSTR
ncbi:DUF4115 domain-containing protein [Limosilactobacillus mucosae]|uniref:helix-turn-helix domain-containing protein n=1 Tax=Limosilactobacillus mucosae TaxID=97478 RepID=UPI00233EB6CE|nr:RodZ domain-containing protein [Limosilactobacillus mucosae]MDC2845812.1 DUF4115 domain-containing protein [Limosilactobacillus mucosae]